ncbi:PfkB family carbohydrate kinase [Liquorilactobacillus sucicola]|nr:PfkB family carbohydrate kinase [Liquorilactobacillus sucicola]
MKKRGRLLLAEDISAIGSLSTTVALPLLVLQGITPALLPTSILSTQSEGYGQPISLPVAQWVPRVLQHWNQQKLKIDGALIGYIGDLQVGKRLVTFLTKNKLPFVFIDPVFADGGKLYPNLAATQLEIMCQLIQQAHIITPNYTEALLLTAGRIESEGDQQQAFSECELLERLEKMMQHHGRAVITGVEQAGKIGCIWRDENGCVRRSMFPRLHGHFYGSGDVFAALLTAFLWKGRPFSESVSEATLLTYQALKDTADANIERRAGIDISGIMRELAQKNTD